MCGITGLWDLGAPDELAPLAKTMADAIAHRGPDASGVWVDRDARVALGHRRLSILDVSELGTQPMLSRSERYALVYNGEVYNFAALRKELEQRGHTFRGRSDTEVLLAGFEEWGVRHAVERFVGMFAFALWDRELRQLHLGRDRLGIKPLYVARIGRGLAFASELASFGRVPGFARRVDRATLSAYFRYACIPSTMCIYDGCDKVGPGELWTLRTAVADPVRERFWSVPDAVADGLRNPLDLSEPDVLDRIEGTLRRSVGDRLVSDVPLGVFLSGGIDSSLVTALMQVQSSAPVKTFSIGFREGAYDEASDAKRVASHLGTDHTELYLTPAEVMKEVPTLGAVYSEPFADSSHLPTLLVSRLARRSVTVALSGDGGDEVFGGYNRHIWGPRVWKAIRAVPAPLWRTVARGLQSCSPDEWDAFASRLTRVIRRAEMRVPGDKAHKLAGLLGARDLEDLYLRLRSIWPEPERLVLGGASGAVRLDVADHCLVAEQIMAWDLASYLPDDILTKVDRASMSEGLEVRVPLLDHRVVELAWRLPGRMRIRGNDSPSRSSGPATSAGRLHVNYAGWHRWRRVDHGTQVRGHS